MNAFTTILFWALIGFVVGTIFGRKAFAIVFAWISRAVAGKSAPKS